MIALDEAYKIGQLGKPHGFKGEVSFSFSSDVWDRVDADYLLLLLDGILVPFFLEEYRFRGEHSALLKFVDLDTADDVGEYCGVEVYFPYSLTPEDEEEDYTWAYFVGFTVEDEKAGILGKIAHVNEDTQNVLFEVASPQGTLLIPAVEAFIKDIDHTAHIVHMQLPEGLIELN